MNLKHSFSLEEVVTKWTRLKSQRSTINAGDTNHILPKNSYSILDRKKNTRSFAFSEGLGLSDIEEGSRTDGARSENEEEEDQQEAKNFLQEADEGIMQFMEHHSSEEETNSNFKDNFFDEPFKLVEERIKKKSIYRNFKTWKLVNLMVKTGDNLKQCKIIMI